MDVLGNRAISEALRRNRPLVATVTRCHPVSPGALQELLKHAGPELAVRGTDRFPLRS